MTVRLSLHWIAPKKGDYPFSPVAHIIPESYSQAEDGHVLLTPQCMTPTELDEQVDQMKSDLEEIRQEGHRRFASHRKSVKSN